MHSASGKVAIYICHAGCVFGTLCPAGEVGLLANSN